MTAMDAPFEHLSEETLALLAERGARPAEDDAAIAHLARCRRCMSAYSDAVRYHVAWTAAPTLFAEGSHARTRGGSPPRIGLLHVFAAATLVVAIGWFWPRPSPSPHAVAVPGSELAHLLASASSEDLVYPGGESGAAQRSSAYRSLATGGASAEHTIEALRDRYENHGRAIADLYSLAAALAATGRSNLAHDYVKEGRALAPRHTGFLALAAILAHRGGEDAVAEQLLAEASEIAPDDATLLLDRALLLTQATQVQERERLLDTVIRRAPGSPLAERAQRLRLLERRR